MPVTVPASETPCATSSPSWIWAARPWTATWSCFAPLPRIRGQTASSMCQGFSQTTRTLFSLRRGTVNRCLWTYFGPWTAQRTRQPRAPRQKREGQQYPPCPTSMPSPGGMYHFATSWAWGLNMCTSHLSRRYTYFQTPWGSQLFCCWERL